MRKDKKETEKAKKEKSDRVTKSNISLLKRKERGKLRRIRGRARIQRKFKGRKERKE